MSPPAALLAIAVVALTLGGCNTVDEASQTDPPGAPTRPRLPGDPSPATPAPAPSVPGPEDTGPPPSPELVAVDSRTVVSDLRVPWAMAGLPDGDVLVTERDEARVLRVSPDGQTRDVEVVGDGGIDAAAPDGEGGLLGITVLPGGDVVIVVSTDRDNRVVRYTYDGTGADGGILSDPRVLVSGIPRAGVHNGGRVAVGPDGYLYVTTGDATDREAAQDPDSLAGKILRVTLDGDPAPGNPDPASPVWSLGHRNVQGIGWSADGTMFASEFGQDTWDELNVVTPGANYGWPVVEGPGGMEQGFVDPVVAWRTDEASPSGLAVTGNAVWVSALRGERLWRVPVTGDPGDPLGEPEAVLGGDDADAALDERGYGRLRDVMPAADGSLWVLTSNTSRGDPRDGDDRIVRVILGQG